MKSYFFIALQYLAPQHLISRLIGRIAASRINWLKSYFIHTFADRYQVNMAEAEEENLDAYASFNAFFVRALKTDARPLANTAENVICPADGAVSQRGKIDKGVIFQAKGKSFTCSALLGGDSALAAEFEDGEFCTIYLSPKDYHRVHMPLGGKLRTMIHVPGALFSVNPTTTNNVDALFARNERVVTIFDTAVGPMAVVLVGAMIVASIETVWAGEIAPRGNKTTKFSYNASESIELPSGAEMGRFKLGSTAVVLFPKGTVDWGSGVLEGSEVKMGESLGGYSRPVNVA